MYLMVWMWALLVDLELALGDSGGALNLLSVAGGHLSPSKSAIH